MGAQRALGRRGPKDPEALDAVLIALVDRLARRLRAAGRVCRTIVIRLRFDDYARATRSSTLTEATAQTQAILATARGLLAAAIPMIERRGITLIGVALTNLSDDDAVQLALPLEEHRALALDLALDELRERYGPNAVTRAVLLGRDQGLSVPLLPD
jgi:DNA polymerase-4